MLWYLILAAESPATEAKNPASSQLGEKRMLVDGAHSGEMVKRRRLQVVGTASYLGDDYSVELTVKFGERTHVKVDVLDSGVAITVTADVTGKEDRMPLVTDCLEQWQGAYEDANGEPPTKMLSLTWEKALNAAWARVLKN
jgi:hypothetical protein